MWLLWCSAIASSDIRNVNISMFSVFNKAFRSEEYNRFFKFLSNEFIKNVVHSERPAKHNSRDKMNPWDKSV